LLYSSARSGDGENTGESVHKSVHKFGDRSAMDSRTPKRARRIARMRPARQDPHAASIRADPPRGKDAHRTGNTRQTSERRANLSSGDAPLAKAKPAKR
jgi:hypothetical protein